MGPHIFGHNKICLFRIIIKIVLKLLEKKKKFIWSVKQNKDIV